MRLIALCLLAAPLGAAAAIATAGDAVATDPTLTAQQIVEKNVAARGGLEAWRKIRTMVWLGHIESANAPTTSMPFMLEQERPNKTHFEIAAQKKQISVRIFDGTRGWKQRPSGTGEPTVEPYTTDELNFARDSDGIDGPLIDYAARGEVVTLEGTDMVDGRPAYRLSVGRPSSVSRHVWVDAQSFLDIKYDRRSRSAIGYAGTVSVYNRNFQMVEGVQIPMLVESGGDTGKVPDRMVIDKIALNPALDDRAFARPAVTRHRRGAMLDITGPTPGSPGFGSANGAAPPVRTNPAAAAPGNSR